MSIIVDWDSPVQTTIQLGFNGDWGWLTLRNKLRMVFAIMRKAPNAIDLIFDFTYTTGLPPSPVANLNQLRHYLPPNLGTLVLIVPDARMRAYLMPLCQDYADAGMRLVISPTQTDVQRMLRDIHYEQLAHRSDEWV